MILHWEPSEHATTSMYGGHTCPGHVQVLPWCFGCDCLALLKPIFLYQLSCCVDRHNFPCHGAQANVAGSRFRISSAVNWTVLYLTVHSSAVNWTVLYLTVHSSAVNWTVLYPTVHSSAENWTVLYPTVHSSAVNWTVL
jgi:hypothetical protein